MSLYTKMPLKEIYITLIVKSIGWIILIRNRRIANFSLIAFIGRKLNLLREVRKLVIRISLKTTLRFNLRLESQCERLLVTYSQT